MNAKPDKFSAGIKQEEGKLAALFGVAEQFHEALLAISAEVHDPAARSAVARGPFQFGEPPHDRRAHRSGEVMPSLAPVQTRFANGSARMDQCFRRDLQGARQETLAFVGELNLLLLLADQPLHPHAVEHLHAEIAGKMIIADPGAA